MSRSVPQGQRAFFFDRTFDVVDQTKYPAGFFAWFDNDEGTAIWREFELRTNQVAKRREYYSAQAICEVIRWETMLVGGTEFKLNNNWVSGLARLWMFKYGKEHPGFFRIRDSLGRDI